MVQKLIVEVVDARNLMPKDGHGTSSPYVQVDYYGQRKRTKTAICELNPTWNEVLEFNVAKPSDAQVLGDMLEVIIYHDKNHGPTTRNNFLGWIRLNSTQLFVKKGEEALIYFPLQKKSLFSWIQGDIGLKIYYVDHDENEVVPPPPPPEPEKKQEEPPAVAAAAPPPEPAPAPPAADGEKPNEEPPAAAAAAEAEAEAAAAPPPENAEVEAEKPTESSQPPPQPTVEESTPPEVDSSTVGGVEEPTPPDDPVIEMMPASVSRSMSEVRIAGPQPIKRPFTGHGSNFTPLDPTESMTIEKSSFDLVEKMHYLFVQVVKARKLPSIVNPIVRIGVSGGHHAQSNPARKSPNFFFEWDQTFAFGRNSPDSCSTLEVSVWDSVHNTFLGGICFDVTEIPLRDPPDSPLAPQWYRLDGNETHYPGELMLATWIGTQADEAFPDATKSTDCRNNVNSRAKVYQSPKLWYLRATVVEARDILDLPLKDLSFQIKAQLGIFQVLKTKVSVTRDGSPSWNEDLLFIAAEPFSDYLIFFLEMRQSSKAPPATIGIVRIPNAAIERRVDDRKVASQWFNLEAPNSDEKRAMYKGRVHLRLCFDGGYHVMDEAAHLCSDYRPTARQLWKPPVGTIELGIIGCKSLIPMKTMGKGKGFTDAYCVAKYGSKWIRTRTISDSLEPKWNEQYTWKVYDPCTVLSVGVFDDSSGILFETDSTSKPDSRIGKVRVRISTLQTGKVYRNLYPLLVLSNSGMKKMGDLEIAIRFTRAASSLDILHVYSQPLLPLMHHIKPLGIVQQEMLRNIAAKTIAVHLSRSEPPVKREVVLYMLDADSQGFSMRKVRVNYFRIINVIVGFMDIIKWVEEIRTWRNPMATILVHALFVMLVWFPDLIVPTLAFYVFVIGAWNYRFKSREPLPHFDPKISLVDGVDRDELDEEFDMVPSNRPNEVVRARYDKLRTVGARVQRILGDIASQGERVQALVTWRDPRATGIFVGLCFVVAMILYMVPSKMVAMAFGFYYLRHPIFRDRMPSPALNFFRRLPSLSDRIM